MLVEKNIGLRPNYHVYPWQVQTPWIRLQGWKEAEYWCIHTLDCTWTRYGAYFYFDQHDYATTFCLRWLDELT